MASSQKIRKQTLAFRMVAIVVVITQILTPAMPQLLAQTAPVSGAPVSAARVQLAPYPEPPPVLTPMNIIVNRTAPLVSPPSEIPTFSDSPKVEEFRRARVVSEPLVPLKGIPSALENQALAQTLSSYYR